MSLSTTDITHILAALAALLAASHGIGFLFARFRQPRVIGEIIGGLLCGPTVLGAAFPGIQRAVFPDWGPTPVVLGAIYQLGLLLLMFSSGAEIRAAAHRGEGRTVFAITAAGTLIPFVAGVGFVNVIDCSRHQGPAATSDAFLLVFACAVAVTSIPVISRIMHDLGILETPFARIVLAAAVIEDILLYVILAVAVGVALHQPGRSEFGLIGLLGIPEGREWRTGYHVVATLAFFVMSLTFGPRVLEAVRRFRFNLLNRSSPIAFQLVFLLALTGVCVFLGVAPMFGAFVAGMVAGTTGEDPSHPREAIKSFAFAFFIPVYFAIVGLKLDLLKAFDPLFFLGFLAFACVVKAASVYGGARMAGESGSGSWNLAVAMNARGGPGIVLASVALDARIINDGFYATLVLVAIVTSLLAGSWLERAARGGRALR